jgi:hypothetical protein
MKMKALDPRSTGAERSAVILAQIREVVDVPKDAVYKQGAETIHFTNFGSLEGRHIIIEAMIDRRLASKGRIKRYGMYDHAVTTFYILRKSGKKKFISITLKHGGTTPVKRGLAAEKEAADAMTKFFASNDLSTEYTAEASGGNGHDKDVKIKNLQTGDVAHSYEIKASDGSRTDYGQCVLSYDLQTGWIQETGQENEALKSAFAILQPKLNDAVRPAQAPVGPRFNDRGAAQFWHSYMPDRTNSVSGDVVSVKIPPQYIEDYYAAKGNDYIIVGDNVYSLGGPKLRPLSSAIENATALFRIKDHSSKYSYTVALRASFKKTPHTDFNSAMKIIYLT